MKAIVVTNVGVLSCVETEKPIIKKDEVLVRVKAAGLCGSDAHIFHGTYPASYPIIQGHEFSGIIEEIGSEVVEWSIGQRVTADPNINCGYCYYCLRDQENMCENSTAIGVTRNGAFAEYVAVPQTQLYELPDNVLFEEGALVEPLACVTYAMKRLQLSFGSKVVIFGMGPMGLLLLLALKTSGASDIAVIDLESDRLKVAKEMGANSTYAEIEELKQANPRGFDVVVDATGNGKVIEAMFSVAAKRAKILQFGCADTNTKITINPFMVYNNDWEYIGTRTAVHTFGQAIDMLSSKRIDVSKIISETVSLDKMADYLKNGKPASALKIVVKP